MSTEQDGIRKASGQRALRRPADDIIGRPNLRVKTAGSRAAQRMGSRPPGDQAAPRPVILAPAAAAAAIASAPTAAAAAAPAAAAPAPATASAEVAPATAAAPAQVQASVAAPDDVAAAATIIVEPAPEAEAPVISAAPAGAEEPVVTADDEPTQLMGDVPRKTSKLPRIDPKREPSPFATHRPAPPDEEAEKAQLAALTGQKVKAKAPERQVSTGFLLGAGLIVMLLVGGVIIARMETHVRKMETRISLLEQIQLRTVAVAPRQR